MATVSAIDFDMPMDRWGDSTDGATPKTLRTCDRVKLTTTGKFLPFKYYGAQGNDQAYGYKEG